VREEFKIEILPETFEPIDVVDYVYALLHSPTYKEKCQEIMKVPYPKDKALFWQLVKLGKELRLILLKMDG
jgi:predicted helicase